MKTPRNVLLMSALCLSATTVFGQNSPTFYRQFGTGANDFAFGVALDATGVYIVGCVNDTIPPPPAKPCEGNPASADAFVRKYETNGAFAWEVQFGTALNDVARGVATDASGVYVAGYTHNPATTEANAFVRKYSHDGSTIPLWTREIGTVVPDFAFAVAVDSTGVYVTGLTKGDFSKPVGVSAGLSDVFVVKLDLNSGEPLWTPEVRQYDIGTNSTDAAFAVAADNLSFYIGGSTAIGIGQSDSFVGRYNAATGVLAWEDVFGSNTQDDAAFGVAVDTGGVYIAGCTHDANADGSCDSGNGDAFVRKYGKSLGDLLWDSEFGSTDELGNPGPFDAALSVTTDVNGVYVGGYTDGRLPGQTVSGNTDAFVRKYNSNGNELWTTQFGSVPATAADLTWGVVAASSSGVYAGGYTNGTMPGQNHFGGFDAYLVKNPQLPVHVGGVSGGPSTIKLGSNGVVPVAILSTATFDATAVDPMSISLAGATVRLKGNGTYQASVQDVNGDGIRDLVVQVTTEALQLSETDAEAVLEGMTFTGQAIRGKYLVRIVP